ncbi:Asparaginase/glutaminase [Desulfovibrio sp. X2]|uniref:asparaginase domain-containing protein n=1 Tax=Desulfovibrio sp. X2 TaxID=941449 RepID=UPI000358E9F5|nr:asparaginase domain-containing protein [Desulfovibrio sp. X2]EPR43479.1 Asparaginase/glutaminase [Desulfovibrio sp. X2]
MRLKIFSMGGTIDKIYFDDLSTYEVGEPQAGEILREAGVTFEFSVEEVMRKDSLHLTAEDRAVLRSRIEASEERHILITHGTDTMVETAAALKGLAKVIVFTGAITPARFKGSDAPFNLGCAVGAVQSLPDGVYIAMSGRIFEADKVRKNRAAGRFEDA